MTLTLNAPPETIEQKAARIKKERRIKYLKNTMRLIERAAKNFGYETMEAFEADHESGLRYSDLKAELEALK